VSARERLARGWARHGWRLGVHALAELARDLDRARRHALLRLFHPIAIGRDASIEPDVIFPTGRPIRIGARVFIGRRSIFELDDAGDGPLDIGDDTWISHDCHVQAHAALRIGRQVLVGEFTSIRDTTHRYDDPARPVKEQGDVYGRVTVEDGVWIGRGCLVLGRPEGVVLGEGSIIAANSVVHGSVPPGTIWGGAPARQLAVR
jgi:acetyltransferase-like isoleucine patch superfamily enzyme